MFTVQMGMLLSANLSVGKNIYNVLIPVTLVNIVGGAFFVGFTYWYLYLAGKDDISVRTNTEASIYTIH